MTRLKSTKEINKLKLRSIKNGGYKRNASKIIKACTNHMEAFGIDLLPQQLK